MKKIFSFLLLTALMATATITNATKVTKHTFKDPIVIEVATKHTTISDALSAAKTSLLVQKFILDGSMSEKSFTAKRTTNAKADYYVADVNAKLEGGKAHLTITFVKVGTGLLKLQKIADTVKADLEK